MVDPKHVPDRFEILDVMEDNALEHTVRAHDALLERDVMLKLPANRAAETWSAKVKERLLREARAVAKIRHDSIAPIHWVEQTEAGPLLVLDLPEGETLAEKLADGPLDPGEVIAIGKHVAEALAEVHFHSVVHRCIGPSSIRLLPNGKVQLGAFTFAKEFGSHHAVSSLHHGKREQKDMAELLPDYSAPEQLAGHAAEPRSDIFALGCTLYRCLAGKDPFEAGREHEPPEELRKLRKDVSKPLAELIRKCIKHGKTARYANAQQVVDAFKELEEKAGSQSGGKKVTTLAVAAAGVVTIALLLVFVPPMLSSGGLFRGPGPSDQEIAAKYQATYDKGYRHVHGLFIGIGQAYRGTSWTELKNPLTEIKAVSDQLKRNDPQWQRSDAITMLEDDDATYDRVTKELETLVQNAQSEDAVLIYFAGHGASTLRSFGLCLADVHGTVENGTGYLRREVLCSYLDRIKAKHALVILDCCHSAAVFDMPKTIGDGRGRGIGEKAPLPGWHHRQNFSREFLCSAGANELASDGKNMSPFATEFVKQLRATDSTHIAAKFLSPLVGLEMERLGVSRAARVQVPRYRAEQEGSFVFMLGK